MQTVLLTDQQIKDAAVEESSVTSRRDHLDETIAAMKESLRILDSIRFTTTFDAQTHQLAQMLSNLHESDWADWVWLTHTHTYTHTHTHTHTNTHIHTHTHTQGGKPLLTRIECVLLE